MRSVRSFGKKLPYTGRAPITLLWIGLFAVVGLLLLVLSRAATPFYSLEPETAASITGGAVTGTDANASGAGKGFVQFKAAVASGTWPSSPAAIGANICGNAAVLTGPSTPPAGAVVVPAGDNSGFNFFSSNTTYYFATGVHTLGTSQFGQIVAKPGNKYIGAPGAIIDGQGINRYAFTDSTHTATNVTIQYLTIRNFGSAPTPNGEFNDDGTPRYGGGNNNEGVVNHDAVSGWTISNNTITNVKGAAVFLGSNNTVSYNCLKDNGQYGFSAYVPPVNGDAAIKNVVLDHNEIVGNNTDRWEQKNHGCGCTGGGKFWDVKGARVTNNWVHDNLSVGLWADTNNIDFLFENNYIDKNDGEGIWYEISYNAMIRNNYFGRNAWVKGDKDRGSPGPAIYLSESGGDSRLQGTTSGTNMIDINNNYFIDNMAGIMVYENVNRFCNSRGNTSGGYCTPFVNPTNFNSNPPEPPYLSYPAPINNTHLCYTGIGNSTTLQRDCRWRSQNITIHNNEFRMTTANIPLCTSIPLCGTMSLFATGANNIPWAPASYQVSTIQNEVTFNQNNKWTNNKYFGPWKMRVGNSVDITSTQWRAAPYNQDVGSTFQ